jgi:hypothetical protein
LFLSEVGVVDGPGLLGSVDPAGFLSEGGEVAPGVFLSEGAVEPGVVLSEGVVVGEPGLLFLSEGESVLVGEEGGVVLEDGLVVLEGEEAAGESAEGGFWLAEPANGSVLESGRAMVVELVCVSLWGFEGRCTSSSPLFLFF